MRRTPRILYAALLGAVFGLAVLAGWTTLAAQIDSDVYDFLFRLDQRPREPAKSVIYGIDERTLRQGGGLAGLRGILANGLERLRPCLPKAVALDIVLADETAAKEENDRLIWALGRLPNAARGVKPDGAWLEIRWPSSREKPRGMCTLTPTRMTTWCARSRLKRWPAVNGNGPWRWRRLKPCTPRP